MKKKLTSVLLLGIFLISSLGFTSCKDTPITPNFENFPLDIEASLRWGTGYDTTVYVDLIIINNTHMVVDRAWSFLSIDGPSDTTGTSSNQCISQIVFPGGGLKPNDIASVSIDSGIKYVYEGNIAADIECEMIFWWVKFDKKGADWGDPKIDQRCPEEVINGTLDRINCYSEGYHIDVVSPVNPY